MPDAKTSRCVRVNPLVVPPSAPPRSDQRVSGEPSFTEGTCRPGGAPPRALLSRAACVAPDSDRLFIRAVDLISAPTDGMAASISCEVAQSSVPPGEPLLGVCDAEGIGWFFNFFADMGHGVASSATTSTASQGTEGTRTIGWTILGSTPTT